MEKIAVIGAGPAGCCAAYMLQKQGHEVFLLEKDKQVGGRTHSYRQQGFHLDTGAAFFTNFYPRVLKLMKTLGLKPKVKALKRINALSKQEQTALLNISSLPSFLRFPFVGKKDKSKMLRWVLKMSLKRKRVDLVRPVTLLKYDHQSVSEYALQKLNSDIYHHLIRPGIEPFWYFSCEEISAGLLIALTARAAGAKFYRLDQGIDQLCTSLIKNVHTTLSAEVKEIHINTHGYTVKYESAEQAHTLHVDRVICATTAQHAFQLVKDLPSHLVTDIQKEFLHSQSYVPNIHAAFKVSGEISFPKYSSLFPCGAEEHHWAAISFHPQINQSQERMISIYLSSSSSKRLLQEESSDQEIYEYCLSTLRTFHPRLASQCEPFHLIKRTHAIPIHQVGRYTQAFEFQKAQRQSSILFCGDYLSTATIEGAIYSGMCVNDAVLDQTQAISKRSGFFKRMRRGMYS